MSGRLQVVRHSTMSGGRHFCLIVALLATAGCGREGPVGVGAELVTASVVTQDDVDDVRIVQSTLAVQYRTSASWRNCDAHAEETPQVWDLIVSSRLEDPDIVDVMLIPEDPTGTSVAMTFTKAESGQWVTKAPCSIAIPAGN